MSVSIEEFQRLQQKYADLEASTILWIRLYEQALARANGERANGKTQGDRT